MAIAMKARTFGVRNLISFGFDDPADADWQDSNRP
jgi:hypothetical protein